MKVLGRIGVSLVLVVCWPSFANAGFVPFADFRNPTVLDFTPASGFTELQTYLSTNGVSSSNVNVIATSIPEFAVLGTDPLNYGRAVGHTFNGPTGSTGSFADVYFFFQQPVTQAGATVFYGPGFPYDYTPFSITLNAYSEEGLILGSVTSDPLRAFHPDLQPDRQFLGIETDTSIAFISFSARLPDAKPADSASLLVDYLTYSLEPRPVPAPASLTAALLGIFTLIAYKRLLR